MDVAQNVVIAATTETVAQGLSLLLRCLLRCLLQQYLFTTVKNLNGLYDSLYNVYCAIKTAKELWESLDRKYKTEDAGAKKFVVGRFLDFKMVDSRIVISQVQEIQVILHEIQAEGMILSETFQVASIIEKLPPGWKDFKNYLKHK